MPNFKRFCFLCLFMNLFFPLLSAYAQPAAGPRAALEALEKYRSTGDKGNLKTALEQVDRAVGGLQDAGKNPSQATVWALAYVADVAYQATGDEKYLESAEKLAASVKEKLNACAAGSGPEGSMAVAVLLDLYHITGTKVYKEEALRAVNGLPEDTPAARKCRETAFEFIIVGKVGSPGTEELLRKSFMFDEPNRTVVVLDPGRNKMRLDQLGYEYPGRSCLFVCSDKTCFPPAYPGEDLTRIKQSIQRLKEMK